MLQIDDLLFYQKHWFEMTVTFDFFRLLRWFFRQNVDVDPKVVFHAEYAKIVGLFGEISTKWQLDHIWPNFSENVKIFRFWPNIAQLRFGLYLFEKTLIFPFSASKTIFGSISTFYRKNQLKSPKTWKVTVVSSSHISKIVVFGVSPKTLSKYRFPTGSASNRRFTVLTKNTDLKWL